MLRINPVSMFEVDIRNKILGGIHIKKAEELFEKIP